MTIRMKKLPKWYKLKNPESPDEPLKSPRVRRSPGKAKSVEVGGHRPAEREIQRSIVAYLESLGAVVIRVNSGAVKSEGRFTRFNSLPGCPDLIACLPMVSESGYATGQALFLAVEVKAAKGKTTDLQNDAISRLAEAGAIVVVARSIEDVRKTLEEKGLIAT